MTCKKLSTHKIGCNIFALLNTDSIHINRVQAASTLNLTQANSLNSNTSVSTSALGLIIPVNITQVSLFKNGIMIGQTEYSYTSNSITMAVGSSIWAPGDRLTAEWIIIA